MCGITGFLDQTTSTPEESLRATVSKMAETLHHRGPDDTGLWVDAATGISLGHKRLSVVDLSEKGHQPMHSACGRYTIVYNGEIYNHAVLREELEKRNHHFQSHCDTEVLLASIVEHGIAETLKRSIGMFAFAVWDREKKELTLARDRLGIKPLYYGGAGDCFLFGSELKALVAHPAFCNSIDRGALALFLEHSYIPAPFSIYKGIQKLPPGTMLTVSSRSDGVSAKPTPYWSMFDVVTNAVQNPFKGSDDDAIGALDECLSEAVRIRMEADVPLGAFLSGGIDSSLVVALMQAQSTRKVASFSIGFSETEYNEANYAKAVAKHLGTNHTEYYVTPSDARDVIPRLPRLYDEPFADSSQIPTFLVSEMARKHVTVCLSGDGGDEFFAGYRRYDFMQQLWNRIGWCPGGIRKVAGSIIKKCAPGHSFGTLGRKARTLASFLLLPDARSMYTRMHTHWKDGPAIVIDGTPHACLFSDHDQWARPGSFLEDMLFVDSTTYLPDDILVKVDRASMGVSLEARVPLLDHRVVELAWRFPVGMKVRGGESKWILRQLLDRYVPRELIERPKVGFGVPIDSWLRGPLREWAEDLLDENRLQQEGFFQTRLVRQKWEEHLSEKHNWHYQLWDVLMFQAWLAEQSK